MSTFGRATRLCLLRTSPHLNHPCAQQLDRATTLVVDCLIGEGLDLFVDVDISSGMKLSHEDDDHVFLGVDHKACIKKSSPVVGAGRAQFRQRPLYPFHAKTEPKALVWADLAKLVARHQFHGLSA